MFKCQDLTEYSRDDCSSPSITFPLPLAGGLLPSSSPFGYSEEILSRLSNISLIMSILNSFVTKQTKQFEVELTNVRVYIARAQ